MKNSMYTMDFLLAAGCFQLTTFCYNFVLSGIILIICSKFLWLSFGFNYQIVIDRLVVLVIVLVN